MSTLTLSLSDEERDALQQILSSYLSDLRMEVADTDSFDFREKLKSRERFIKDLLTRL